MGVSIKDIRWVQISVTLASRSRFGGQILWKSWECSAKGLKLILWCTATHLCVMLPSKTHSVLRCTGLYLQFSLTGLLSPDFLLKVPPHAQPSALSSCSSSRSWHCSLNPLHHPSPRSWGTVHGPPHSPTNSPGEKISPEYVGPGLWITLNL